MSTMRSRWESRISRERGNKCLAETSKKRYNSA